jgi:hypothetical protein
MIVSDLSNNGYLLLTKPLPDETITSGIYCGDLLSFVLSGAKAGNILVTIIANLNTIAVASLVDLPVIIFAQGVHVSKEMIIKAEQEMIVLMSSSMTSAEIIIDLVQKNLL